MINLCRGSSLAEGLGRVKKCNISLEGDEITILLLEDFLLRVGVLGDIIFEILGDTITKVLYRLWPTIPNLLRNRYMIIFLCSCSVTLPLSLYRNIAKLSRISLIGLILVSITLLMLIKRGYDTISFMFVENKFVIFY